MEVIDGGTERDRLLEQRDRASRHEDTRFKDWLWWRGFLIEENHVMKVATIEDHSGDMVAML